MADMLDPSIAEKLARFTKQIATNTAAIKTNLATASGHMVKENRKIIEERTIPPEYFEGYWRICAIRYDRIIGEVT